MEPVIKKNVIQRPRTPRRSVKNKTRYTRVVDRENVLYSLRRCDEPCVTVLSVESDTVNCASIL